jgi:hypothetical protein
MRTNVSSKRIENRWTLLVRGKSLRCAGMRTNESSKRTESRWTRLVRAKSLHRTGHYHPAFHSARSMDDATPAKTIEYTGVPQCSTASSGYPCRTRLIDQVVPTFVPVIASSTTWKLEDVSFLCSLSMTVFELYRGLVYGEIAGFLEFR